MLRYVICENIGYKTLKNTHARVHTYISLYVLQIHTLHRKSTHTHTQARTHSLSLSERRSLLIVKQEGPSRSLSSGM